MRFSFKTKKVETAKAAIIANDDLGLTLSGGGSRGAYQMGVWKALRELGLDKKLSFVCGSSVGAINTAVILQDDFDKAIEMWSALEYHNIFKDYENLINILRVERKPITLLRKLITERGLNVDPLKNLLYEHLDEDKIRESPLGMGIVVFDLEARKAVHLTKEQIPYGKMIDYIIASASFPLFQAHTIDNRKFLDGGLGDNRPLQFLMEAEHIQNAVLVDVTVARYFWQKKPKSSIERVDYLAPSRFLGSPLRFDSRRIRKNIELGYNETMAFYNESDS